MNCSFSVIFLKKSFTLSRWEAAETLMLALTVRGCATIPKLWRVAKPCWLSPNCWRVLTRATWNELTCCDREYIIIYMTTMTLRLVKLSRLSDARFELIAEYSDENSFVAPTCLHIPSNRSGSITGGCGS